MKRILTLSGLLMLGNAYAEESEMPDLGDSYYIGAGIDLARFTSQSEVANGGLAGGSAKETYNRKFNRGGGTIAVGGNRRLANGFNFGWEISLDASRSESHSDIYAIIHNADGSSRKVGYYGKVRGVIPSLVVRVGYNFSPSTMGYVRFGASYVQFDFGGDNLLGGVFNASLSETVRVVGVGVEQRVYGNFGVRLEGDYRFYSGKISSGVSRNVILANRIKSCTLRLMGTYNFKF